jgi:O-methyltransferase involved in polyketide biosynthesis
MEQGSGSGSGGDSSRISPTAHYTSWVWYRAGISHRALTSTLGRALHLALLPMNAAYERFASRPNLDTMLLARHAAIDALLAAEIASGRVGQVIEVASGLSPRGFTFARRHPSLRYLEADLPDMAATKRRRLDEAGLRASNHHVLTVDAMRDAGDDSLGAIAASHLDPSRGTAIVTEGLLGYFDRESVESMWRRFAAVLRGYPSGIYLSDLNLAGDLGGMHTARVFRRVLEAFARGRVHLHYESPSDVARALRDAGFSDVSVLLPTEVPHAEIPAPDRKHVVRILTARTPRTNGR